ncbi:MAG: hypothetical protein COA79_06820 [Planctomycetota bacterium]|nr:MAG: hypothetical protein COA79_06820 [Planctomycetota bacterium]
MKNKDKEFYFTTFEKFHKYKVKPKAKQSLRQLIVSEEEAENIDEPPTFKDIGLEALHEEGHLDHLAGVIRSGKEATVYLGKYKNTYIAVKIYADRSSCLFQKKNIYCDGRTMKNKRYRKALLKNTRIGKGINQALWIEEEYKQLSYFYLNEIPVPRPISQSERVIVMELIGDNGMPAPRLSDLNLSNQEAKMAFNQSVYNLGMILKAGRVHGDYSTYNILWWDQKAIVIDFPQTVSIENNHNFIFLLNRDISSLCKSFSQVGYTKGEEIVKREVLEISQLDLNDFQ